MASLSCLSVCLVFKAFGHPKRIHVASRRFDFICSLSTRLQGGLRTNLSRILHTLSKAPFKHILSSHRPRPFSNSLEKPPFSSTPHSPSQAFDVPVPPAGGPLQEPPTSQAPFVEFRGIMPSKNCFAGNTNLPPPSHPPSSPPLFRMYFL